MQVFLSTRSSETALPESTTTNREPIRYSKTDFCFTTKTHLIKKSSVRKDQPIFLVGEPPKGLYFIAKGSVFLTTDEHAKFAELYETDFFGEGSIITSTSRSKNVYALEDCSPAA